MNAGSFHVRLGVNWGSCGRQMSICQTNCINFCELMQLHRFLLGWEVCKSQHDYWFFIFSLRSLAGIISAPPINTNVWAQAYTVWLVTLSSHSDKMLIRKKSKSEPNYYSQSQSSCFIRGFHHCSCWGTDKPLQLAESSLQAREQPRKAYDVQGLHMLKIKKQINPCKLSQNMLWRIKVL